MPIVSLLRAAAAAALLFAFGAAHAQEGPYDTSRVVAIGGSITEVVFALGEQDKLVARDSTSMFPAEALELPDVGYMRALSPEGVLAINPTLIIALEGSGPPEAVDVLLKASVPMVTVPETFDRDGVLAKIRIVGDALDVPGKAAELAAAVEARTRAAEEAAAASDGAPSVVFVLSMQGGRILASGTGTAADGIITMAGGTNAVTGFEGYKQLSEEALIEAAPDVILAMDRGGDHATQVDQLLSHPALAATPAGRDKRVVRMDGGYLLGFGPRTAEAVGDLSAALHGGDASATD